MLVARTAFTGGAISVAEFTPPRGPPVKAGSKQRPMAENPSRTPSRGTRDAGPKLRLRFCVPRIVYTVCRSSPCLPSTSYVCDPLSNPVSSTSPSAAWSVVCRITYIYSAWYVFTECWCHCHYSSQYDTACCTAIVRLYTSPRTAVVVVVLYDIYLQCTGMPLLLLR